MFKVRKKLTLRGAIWLGAICACTVVGPIRAEPGKFVQNPGYESYPVFKNKLVIHGRNGPREVTVDIVKLRVEGGERGELAFEGEGLLLLQHRAGEIEFSIHDSEFEAIEGEWLRLSLPDDVRFSTEDDTALLDGIVIND